MGKYIDLARVISWKSFITCFLTYSLFTMQIPYVHGVLHTEHMHTKSNLHNIAKLPIGSPCTIAGTVHTPDLLLLIELTATTDTAVTAQEHTVTVVLVLVTFHAITLPVLVDVDTVTV